MISVLASRAVYPGLQPPSSQTKDYRIGISAIFPAISWQEQVNFQWDDDEVRFVLDKHTELDFYSAS
jgi:hypothetical protein